MGNESSQQVKFGEKLDNDVKVSWKRATCENPHPARDGHCAAAVGTKLYVFGGVLSTADGAISESNDLLIFDTEEGTWSKADSKGDVPPARSSATLAAVGGKLYLFGGLSRNSGWFDDVYIYDVGTQSWKVGEVNGRGPSPRDKLASTVIGKKIYIFGGFGPQGGMEEVEEESVDSEEEEEEVPEDQDAAEFGWFNDLFIFDTETNTFSNPMQMNLGVPTPRAAHSMCSFDKYLVIFGGRDAEARRNDTHIFDTVTRKWETLQITGREPEPRSFHTATTVGDRMVVLGGRGTKNQHFADFHIFDAKTHQWLQPTLLGDKMAGRGLHTATAIGDKLVVFGGSAEFDPEIMQCTQYFNDVFTSKAEEILAGSLRIISSVTAGSAGNNAAQSEPSASSETTKKEQEEGAPSPKKTRTE